MGEAKRKREAVGKIVDMITSDFSDRGKLIEVGWLALKKAAISPQASEAQLQAMREAFFAGAQHLFASIMGILDPGTEPTARDLVRMDLINHELQAFLQEFKQRHGVGDDVVAPEGRPN